MVFLTILEAMILVSNAFAILNEKRVLQKCNLYLNIDGFDKVDYTRAHEGGS